MWPTPRAARAAAGPISAAMAPHRRHSLETVTPFRYCIGFAVVKAISLHCTVQVAGQTRCVHSVHFVLLIILFIECT